MIGELLILVAPDVVNINNSNTRERQKTNGHGRFRGLLISISLLRAKPAEADRKNNKGVRAERRRIIMRWTVFFFADRRTDKQMTHRRKSPFSRF